MSAGFGRAKLISAEGAKRSLSSEVRTAATPRLQPATTASLGSPDWVRQTGFVRLGSSDWVRQTGFVRLGLRSGWPTVGVWLERREHHIERRGRYAELAAQRDDLARKPWQLQPIAAQ
jgi:hypothetical protein